MEIFGLLSVLPLMQLLTGATVESSSLLAHIASATGTDDRTSLVAVISVAIFVVFLVKALASVVLRWWTLGFIYGEEAEASKALLRYYLHAPFAMHLKRNSAELLRTLNESVSIVFSNVVVGGVTVVTEATTCAFILITLFVVAPLPSLMLTVYFSLASFLFVRLLRARSMRYGQAMHDTSLGIYQTGGQILGGVKEIRIRHVERHFLDRFAQSRDSYAWARRRITFVNELSKYFLEVVFITGLGISTVVLIGATGPNDTLPVLSLLAAAGFRVLPSAARLLGSINGVRVGLPALRAVLGDLETSDELPETPAASASAWTVSRGIRVEGISFTYDGGHSRVLEDVSFDIPAGTSVAIVGASGAGKSTLVDLILGLHTPTEGRILVDGRDIRDDLVAWQRTIGLVPQEVYLLDDTVRATIAFGMDPELVDDAEVVEALKRAQLHDLFAGLSRGLESVVGERGARLSGGQRQRVGIARALYHHPRVLVLDEATSALDSGTESKIGETVDSIRGEVTMVIVAHRLSTVRRCDSLLYLEGGRVAAMGSFDHVRATNHEFARLVELGRLDLAQKG